MGGKKGEEPISKLFWLNDHFNSIVFTDNKQDWRMSVWNHCLEWRNFTEQEVGFQFAQASNECFLFFFLPFPTKTKQCFYVLCKWFRHVVWQFYFCYFFFFFLSLLTKEKSWRKNAGLTFHLDEHLNSEFTWRCS